MMSFTNFSRLYVILICFPKFISINRKYLFECTARILSKAVQTSSIEFIFIFTDSRDLQVIIERKRVERKCSALYHFKGLEAMGRYAILKAEINDKT